MLKKFVHQIIRPRHPWRKMQFDELAELYTSMTIRSLGFGIIGIFVPVYLYKLGVDIQSIFWLFGWIFLLRIPVAIGSAFVVGRIGPKHSIALSTILFVVFLLALLSFQFFGWPLLFLSFLFTLSNGLFFVAYNTDFSKIKNTDHGGKELGWLFIFERLGGAAGPLIGGLTASLIAPELTILLAIAVLAGSLIPLFMTNEPVRVHQHITFRGLHWRQHFRDAVAMGGHAVDKMASEVIWPLLLAVVVFVEATYAKLGSVAALSLVVSLFSAHMFGKFIDSKHGRSLLHYGVVLDSLVYILRPFSLTPAAAVAVSTLNEPITLSYRMPLVKGVFDAADDQEGYRIAYLAWMEASIAVIKMIFFFTLYALSAYYDPVSVLRWSFISMVPLTLLMLAQKFPALQKP